jgi:hypothetical protein
MRTRWLVVLVGLAVGLSACSDAPQQSSARRTPHPSPADRHQLRELLVLGSPAGVTVLDPATGSARFTGAGVPAMADWSKVLTAASGGGETLLRQHQASTGGVLATQSVAGDLAIRVVSPGGTKVALMAPGPPGGSPWIPRPRAFTDIVVADVTGLHDPVRFHLKGNFEPEAFSTDGQRLFLIRYLPPRAPAAYQVATLDLAEAKVYPVYGREKSPVETMAGTRLQQVASPNGARLYALYASQPPAYAQGHDAAQARAKRPVAFVHTLSMDEGWAVCVGLPKALWGGDPRDEALAVSPDGRLLYVVDTARGVISAVDTDELSVVATGRVSFAGVDVGASGEGATRAVVQPDGAALFVSKGSNVMVVDAATLRIQSAFGATGPVSGLAFGADGSTLYMRLPGEVDVLNALSGRRIRMIAVPGPGGDEVLGTLSAST